MHENKFKHEYEKMKKIIDLLRKERNDAIAEFQLLKNDFDFLKLKINENMEKVPESFINELRDRKII